VAHSIAQKAGNAGREDATARVCDQHNGTVTARRDIVGGDGRGLLGGGAAEIERALAPSE